jgi:hypothetical protein
MCSTVRYAKCSKESGRCSPCDLEHRQIGQRTRLKALFVGLGGWS